MPMKNLTQVKKHHLVIMHASNFIIYTTTHKGGLKLKYFKYFYQYMATQQYTTISSDMCASMVIINTKQ